VFRVRDDVGVRGNRETIQKFERTISGVKDNVWNLTPEI